MAEEDEESLRQRLTREREQRRDDGQLERFREGKFKPINPKQREQLERRMAQSDPPPALQRPPQPAAKVEAGLGAIGVVDGGNLDLVKSVYQIVSFPPYLQGPIGAQRRFYFRSGLYVGSSEEMSAPPVTNGKALKTVVVTEVA